MTQTELDTRLFDPVTWTMKLAPCTVSVVHLLQFSCSELAESGSKEKSGATESEGVNWNLLPLPVGVNAIPVTPGWPLWEMPPCSRNLIFGAE